MLALASSTSTGNVQLGPSPPHGSPASFPSPNRLNRSPSNSAAASSDAFSFTEEASAVSVTLTTTTSVAASIEAQSLTISTDDDEGHSLVEGLGVEQEQGEMEEVCAASAEESFALAQEALAAAEAAAALAAEVAEEEHAAGKLLLEAVKRNDLETTRNLCQSWKGKSRVVDATLTRGRSKRTTSAHLAARNGYFDILAVLVDAQAHLDAKDEWGCTPLYLASCWGHEQIVDLLLATASCDVNACADNGNTCVNIASFNGNSRTLAKLLAVPNVLINVQNKDGRSAAFHAAAHDHYACLHLLCAAGAELNLRDNLNRTPLQVARGRGRELLIAKGTFYMAPHAPPSPSSSPSASP